MEKNFFGSFQQILFDDGSFTSIQAIKRSIVPIIKIECNKLSIDLAFSSAPFDYDLIDNNLDQVLLNNDILTRMEDTMIRSYNAWRNAHQLLKSIRDTIKQLPNPVSVDNNNEYVQNQNNPNQNNEFLQTTNHSNLSSEERLHNFRWTMKIIKIWAMRRGIYSNMLGYLGGMSQAILVAKVCQMHPNFCLSKLVERFFFIYQFFPWEDIPLKLVEPQSNLELVERLQHSKGYFQRDEGQTSNRENTSQPKRGLSILTPAFPEMNCAFTILESQEKIIMKSIGESYKQIRLIEENELHWYFLVH